VTVCIACLGQVLGYRAISRFSRGIYRRHVDANVDHAIRLNFHALEEPLLLGLLGTGRSYYHFNTGLNAVHHRGRSAG
jgi:hypothetical protein